MEKVDIFDQEVGRAAIECNGNLVVVFNGKKAFWFKEQIESFVKEHPEAPLPLSVFCVAVSKVGEPCKYKSTGNSFSFVARSVSRSEALSEYIMLSDYEDMIFKQLYCQLSNSDSDLHLLLEEIRKEDDRTPSYLRNVKELEDKSLLHMVVYGDEHEEIFNEGLTDYRWLVEEVTYKIGYSGETVFVTISHTYQ